MELVTIHQLREHCRADAADDSVLTICGNAAEAVCAKLANRNLYPTQEALTASLGTISASMAAANAAYADAVAAAATLTGLDATWAMHTASAALRDAQVANSRIISGRVVTDDLVAAVLLIAAHFYANREEVIAGNNFNAVQIPFGAQAILSANYAIGPDL